MNSERRIINLKINQEITAERLLLIDEEGKMQGEVSRDQALYLAYEKGFDLALINERVNPPIAKLMDYGKYIYNQTKQVQKQKAKAKSADIKEIRLSIKISEHDLEVKVNQAKRFLSEGDKVKVVVVLKGREMMFKDKVDDLINRIKNDAGAGYEKPIERMGTRFFATLKQG